MYPRSDSAQALYPLKEKCHTVCSPTGPVHRHTPHACSLGPALAGRPCTTHGRGLPGQGHRSYGVRTIKPAATATHALIPLKRPDPSEEETDVACLGSPGLPSGLSEGLAVSAVSAEAHGVRRSDVGTKSRAPHPCTAIPFAWISVVDPPPVCAGEGGGGCRQGVSNPIAKNCRILREIAGNGGKTAEKLRCRNQTSRSLEEQHLCTGDTQGTNGTRGGQAKRNCGTLRNSEKKLRVIADLNPPS